MTKKTQENVIPLFKKTNDSSETVYDIIKNNYLFKNNLDNHNVPQYKFITNEKLEIYPNIKIFKTETLNDDNKIINDFLGVNINIKQCCCYLWNRLRICCCNRYGS